MVLTNANSLYTDFLTILIAIGVLAASVGTYVTLILYNSLRFVVYIISPTFSFYCYVIALLMTMYANIPRKHVIQFCTVWKCRLVNRIDRKILQSCPDNIGFTIGPYGIATAKLEILVCDDIIQNAVSLILLF